NRPRSRGSNTACCLANLASIRLLSSVNSLSVSSCNGFSANAAAPFPASQQYIYVPS
ncbi:MAG: hypothetical protein HON42_04760, partial [Alphaproteobacteria bacterium]|nr:hypothetical protein [Alphaproteobacteria bacterium]